MGLAILSDTNFIGDLPVYGDIVAVNDLKVGVRASGLDNFIDLSNLDHTLTNVGCTLSPMLQRATHVGAVTTNYQATSNAFTMYSVVRHSIDAGKAYKHDVGSNFVDSSTGGCGVRVYQGSIGGGLFRITARAMLARKVISTGLLSSFYIDLILLDNLASVPSQLPWYVLALQFDPVAKIYRLSELTMGLSTTFDPSNVLWSQSSLIYADRNAPGFDPTYRLLVDGISTYSGQTLLPEHFCWNRALTNAELTEQLAYSRSFMLNARGVTLP